MEYQPLLVYDAKILAVIGIALKRPFLFVCRR